MACTLLRCGGSGEWEGVENHGSVTHRGSSLSGSTARSSMKCRVELLGPLEATVDLLPLDILEEGVDVLRRGCSVVDRVGVLVHVHDQERRAVRCGLGVVAAPVDAQLATLEVVVQHRPAASTSERRPHRPEEFLEAAEPA